MFSYLNLPLDQAVGIGVPVNTEQEEPLPLLVLTIVCIQNLSMGVLCKTIPNKNKDENPDKTIFAVVLRYLLDFRHDFIGIPAGRSLHAPGEAQWARLDLATLVDGVADPATARLAPRGSATSQRQRPVIAPAQG